MLRRRFLLLLAGAAAWPLTARAQSQPNPEQVSDDAVGQVAAVQGSATVTRGNAAAAALKASDPIFKNDVLRAGADSLLSITFDDESTFSLRANAQFTIDEFVYEEGAKTNKALFNVARGTVAFVASLVAKTGDMKVTTPTAAIGIRGTTGMVDVPEGGPAGGEPKVKLYADPDGRVGRLEVFNPQGERLGILTQSASAFAFRLDAAGRMAAVPFVIAAAEAARDRGMLQRLFAMHNIGRRLAIRRRQLRLQRRRNLRPGPARPGGPRQNLRPLNPRAPRRRL